MDVAFTQANEHEVNNALLAIQLHVDVLTRKGEHARARRNINEAITRIKATVNRACQTMREHECQD